MDGILTVCALEHVAAVKHQCGAGGLAALRASSNEESDAQNNCNSPVISTKMRATVQSVAMVAAENASPQQKCKRDLNWLPLAKGSVEMY